MSGSTLKKLEVEANSEATNFIRSWKWRQKIFYCFHISGVKWSPRHAKKNLQRMKRGRASSYEKYGESGTFGVLTVYAGIWNWKTDVH